MIWLRAPAARTCKNMYCVLLRFNFRPAVTASYAQVHSGGKRSTARDTPRRQAGGALNLQQEQLNKLASCEFEVSRVVLRVDDA